MSAKLFILGFIVMAAYVLIFGLILAITKNKKRAKEIDELKKVKMIQEILGSKNENFN